MKENIINGLKLVNKMKAANEVRKSKNEEVDIRTEDVCFIQTDNEKINFALGLDLEKYDYDLLRVIISKPFNKELVESKDLDLYGDPLIRPAFKRFLAKIPYENAISLGLDTLFKVYTSSRHVFNIYNEASLNTKIKHLKIKQLMLNKNKDLDDVNMFYTHLPIGKTLINILEKDIYSLTNHKFYNILKYNFIYGVYKMDQRFKDLLNNYEKNLFNEECLDTLENIYLSNPDIEYDFINNSNALVSLYYSLLESNKVNDLIDKIGLENLYTIISNIQLSSNINYLSNFEINSLLRSDEINYDNIYETIYKEDSYISKILFKDNVNHLGSDFISLLKRNHKKDVFLKYVYENFDSIIEKSIEVLPFEQLEKFSNLNQLTNTLISEIFNLNIKEDFIKLYGDQLDRLSLRLTPEEYLSILRFGYKIKDIELAIKLYNDLVNNKVKYNNRVLLFKQLNNQDIDYKEFYQNYELFSQGKTLTDLYREYNINKTNWSNEEKLFYVLNYDILSYLPIENLNIKLIVNNFDKIKDYLNNNEDMETIKDKVYEDSLKYLKLFCNLSEDFILKNKEYIIEFCDKGLVEVVQALESNYSLKGYSLQLNNLKLIVAAELSNQLKRIKYVKSDYEIELGTKVDLSVTNAWENCLSVKEDNYEARECDSFEDIIRIGELPNKTCIYWKNHKNIDGMFWGMYNHTLLSNFDTNKKVIYVFDRSGKKVARSILRLTRCSDKNTVSSKLGFINVLDEDIENQNLENTEDNTATEDLVLFVERPYSMYNDYENTKVLKTILDLAIEKAKELNIRLLVSSDLVNELSNIYEEDTFEKLNNSKIYISKSKNGEQYLDSFGGNNGAERGGTYYSTNSIYEVQYKA